MPGETHVAILGGTGYGAGELLRLLTQHPGVRVVGVTTMSRVGERVDRVHPHLRGFYDLRLEAKLPWARLLDAPQAVLVSGLPSGASGAAIESVLTEAAAHGAAARLRVIDLSGDLRLRDLPRHREHYPETPALETLRGRAVYGLTELNRAAIAGAQIVANPGCLATAAILAAAPLMSLGASGVLAVDTKTGSSGSGRQLRETTHHPTRHADFRAYKPLSHQHEPEIVQALGAEARDRVQLSFVVQSMDAARGIFATVHATLPAETDEARLRADYERFYADCPFVRVVSSSPTLQDVVGSNFCDVGVAARGRQVIVMAALDNLVKGMAGAAIQNMNLMCGLDEKAGLWTPSLRPV
ncbi:MAG TPA: N-acetyl-gamma-glutamyl-phosphate reductase [Phycisphaerae bacterium]|nr:N-acetyl-gamma-glutamyl-phosphate reductase [Phycisphaerae bacterium]